MFFFIVVAIHASLRLNLPFGCISLFAFFHIETSLPIEALLNPEKEDDLTQKRPRAAA